MTKDFYRVIKCRMRSDEKFCSLSGPTPNAQSLFEWLLAPPNGGIIPCLVSGGKGAMAEARDWPVEDFSRCFDEIAEKKMAVADWKKGLVWLPNGLKHNAPQSPKCFSTWGRAWVLYPECELRDIALVQLIQFVEHKITSAREASKLAQRREAWRSELFIHFRDELTKIQPRLGALTERLHSFVQPMDFEDEPTSDDAPAAKKKSAPPQPIMRLHTPPPPVLVPRPAATTRMVLTPRSAAAPATPVAGSDDFDDGRRLAHEVIEDGITFNDYRKAREHVRTWFSMNRLPYDGDRFLSFIRGLSKENPILFGEDWKAPHLLVHFAVRGIMLERIAAVDEESAFKTIRERIARFGEGAKSAPRAAARA